MRFEQTESGLSLCGHSALERGARLEAKVKLPDGSPPSAHVIDDIGQDRDFRLDLGNIPPGTQIALVAVDAAGNRSAAETFTFSKLDGGGVAQSVSSLDVALLIKGRGDQG